MMPQAPRDKFLLYLWIMFVCFIEQDPDVEELERPHADRAKVDRLLRQAKRVVHTDARPRDMTAAERYLCDMLWYIISDAEWEFKNGRPRGVYAWAYGN